MKTKQDGVDDYLQKQLCLEKLPNPQLFETDENVEENLFFYKKQIKFNHHCFSVCKEVIFSKIRSTNISLF